MGWWLSIGNTTKFLLMLVICSLVGIMMMLLLMLELLTAKSPFAASAAATVPIKLRCWVKSSGGRGRGGDLTSVLLLELVGGVLVNARSSH